MDQLNTCARDEFAKLAVSYIPHALTLVDRNPFSPTYGCCDREYWHFRTLDFPSGMYQEHALTFASVFTTDFNGNQWYAAERMRDLSIAAMQFACRKSHKDGTCDDYFPWEKAMGALAFSSYAIAESYQLLKLDDSEIAALLLKRAKHMAHHNETGRLSNHQALSALALQGIFEITGEDWVRKAAEDRVALLLDWQHKEEGWFQEYEGADPGYQTCTIDFLGKYFQKTRNEELKNPLSRAVQFSKYFMHPDGSYAGEYGSRNTYHYYPHGFEIAASFEPAAAVMNDRWLEGVRKHKRYFNDDSRLMGHLIHNFVTAWRDYCEDRPKEQSFEVEPGMHWFEDAGLVVAKTANYHGVSGLKKGGVTKVYNREGCVLSDTGLLCETQDSKVLIPHLYDEEHQVTADVEEHRFSVRGSLSYRGNKLASPLKLIIFRLLNMTLGRLAPNLLRFVLQKILITGKNRSPHAFQREVLFSDDEVVIRDSIDGAVEVKRAMISTDATSIYVAASNIYQASVMEPWKSVELKKVDNQWVLERSIKIV